MSDEADDVIALLDELHGEIYALCDEYCGDYGPRIAWAQKYIARTRHIVMKAEQYDALLGELDS